MKPYFSHRKMERTLVICLVVLVILLVSGLIRLSYELRMGKELKEADKETTKDFLDDSTAFLPEYCNLNEKIPDITFTDESGEEKSVKQLEGKPAVLTFWASWCPDCQNELSHLNEFLDLTKKYGDISFILVNKTDNQKETKEKASTYLSDHGIKLKTYYDFGISAYQTLGIHAIPTTLFLDEQGVIRAWSNKPITKISVLEGYLKVLKEGSGTITGDFVKNSLMDLNGGVHTTYDSFLGRTETSDVLSETQGIMLEYALLKNDLPLFDKILSYIQGVMRSSGFTAWKVSGNKPSDMNALVDDLRILNALYEAEAQWGGYEPIIKTISDEIARYGVNKGKYVDFYDMRYKKYADRFTLCYGDLESMEALTNYDHDLLNPYESAKNLILDGKISHEFPLYYSWYHYKTNTYAKDDLNMAEAMLTLLHLSKVHLLNKDSIDWIKNQMKLGGVMARYDVNGRVVDGYHYESTAVYALIAMIAKNEGDKELQGMALKKMEKMRIIDTASPYYGAFGMEDGSGIHSFDQVMAMLAYEYTK